MDGMFENYKHHFLSTLAEADRLNTKLFIYCQNGLLKNAKVGDVSGSLVLRDRSSRNQASTIPTTEIACGVSCVLPCC